MKKAKLFGLATVALTSTLVLAACGSSKSNDSEKKDAAKDNKSVAIVTDVGGVDDRSFNQSAWEGLQAWGKENGLKKGVGGYNYFQSDTESAYATNLNSAVQNGFKTIFGIGFKLSPEIKKAAAQNKDNNFGIIDSVIEGEDNVVSATFKDNEAAYLAGVAAAATTKTNKVGFIGGEEGVVIDRFEAGFVKGVEETAKKLGKTITVDVQYAGSFGDPAKGKAVAAQIYEGGADIIFHASGGTGQGVFQEAKAIDEQLTEAELKDKQVWVIGVDSDQQAEGAFKTKDGKDANLTLCSTLKGVGAAVADISQKAADGKFPGGKHLVYGLKDGGVDLTDGFLSDEAKKQVESAKKDILDGKVEVPEKPSK
ncbi:BMP family protein [Enterococcus cecorum]|uniref:BMP family lipoprotein n=1 Tax=Enterococcus cecorum TaxID=44008 RepID=UPI00326321CB